MRKESYRPDCDSIQILGEPIPSNPGNWTERAQYALAKKARSMEELNGRREDDRTSLGVFKPMKIHNLAISADDPDWKAGFKAAFQQARLWETRTVSKEPPRKVPFKFHYEFNCDDPRCKGHRMMIEDWEVGRLFWRNVDQECLHEEAAYKVRERFFDKICGADKDTHFFVGTILRHPKTWVIIGVFYPKIKVQKQKKEQDTGPSLFDLEAPS